MNFREINLRAISENDPLCREDLERYVPENIVPFPTSAGSITAKRRGVYIHSRIDPEKEAERLIAATIDSGTDTAIFYGFGLGYHIEAFFRAFPAGRAIVIEPEPEFFLGALGTRDLRSLFEQKKLTLLVGVSPDNAAAVLREYESDMFRIVRQRSTYPESDDYYRKIDDILARMASRRDINLNTLKRFGRLWIKNLSRNMHLIKSGPGIRSLENRFARIPALVIAAGPSLDDILPFLKELKKRFLLIAVDTSFNACTRAGAEPDFVVVVDPQYWNTRHLDRAAQSKAILISESSTHPTVFRRLPGKVFLAGSIFPLGKYLEEVFGAKGALGAGGSVATSAWDFARLSGAGPIVMAGLDLGFPDKNTHYKGSFFEDRSYFYARRFSPTETHSFSYLYEAAPRKLPANDGTLTLTDKRMLIYQWWFETQMKLHGNVKTLTLSTRGIRIEGIDLIDLGILLSYPVIRGAIDEVIASCDARTPAAGDSRQFAQALDALLEDLLRLETLCREGLHRIEYIRSHAADDPTVRKEGFSALDHIDRNILDLKHRDIAGFLMGSVLSALREPAAGTDLGTVLDNSEKVYQGLMESIEYHRSTLMTAGKKTARRKA
jgi:hypothetical protein